MLKIIVTIFFISTFMASSAFSQSNSKSFLDITKKSPNDSYVFLFVIRSAAFLDWSTPGDLAKTTLNSYLAKALYKSKDSSNIGHAQVGWSCSNQYGFIEQGATGQGGQSGGQGLGTVKSGWGLSVLDMVFKDGFLETKEQVEKRIKVADKNGDFAWVAFKVSNDSCMNMVNYIQNYRNSGGSINYGFPLDPLKYEGAGCTSFANTALQTTKLDLPILDGWIRYHKMPKKYIGKFVKAYPTTVPLELAKSKDEERNVPMTKFIFEKTSWAENNEPYKDFYFYDPELFYESLIHLENNYRKQIGKELKEPVRSKNYDENQIKTKKVNDSWFNYLNNSSTIIRLEKIHNTTGLVINLE